MGSRNPVLRNMRLRVNETDSADSLVRDFGMDMVSYRDSQASVTEQHENPSHDETKCRVTHSLVVANLGLVDLRLEYNQLCLGK